MANLSNMILNKKNRCLLCEFRMGISSHFTWNLAIKTKSWMRCCRLHSKDRIFTKPHQHSYIDTIICSLSYVLCDFYYKYPAYNCFSSSFLRSQGTYNRNILEKWKTVRVNTCLFFERYVSTQLWILRNP